MTIQHKRALRKNLAKARAALAAKRMAAALDAAKRKPELDHIDTRLGTFTQAEKDPTVVTLQTLQAAIDEVGWQLSVLRQRVGGLL